MAKLADLIWKNAELLRGAFKENEYRKVILPFTILRRLPRSCNPQAQKTPMALLSIKLYLMPSANPVEYRFARYPRLDTYPRWCLS